MLLLPTFRLPTLIHTRSGNAKWLDEISHRNPLWINTKDAQKFGVQTGDLLKIHTEIGYFIDKVWVTEGIKPRRRVKISKPEPNDKYGDIFVDTNKSHDVYKRWLSQTRPAPGPDNQRRPLWLPRSYKPAAEAYYMSDGGVAKS